MPLRWTHAFMDQMRMQADPLADAVVEQLFASGEVGAVNQLMRDLVENDDLPSNQMPLYVTEYLVRTKARTDWLDARKLQRAQEVFDLFGPEVMMILGFYALPASYAARRGVQVLHRTGVLRERSVRRVFETAQMVVDVMTEGGLEPGGRGVRTLQKVRLMHAAIRHMIRHNTRQPWDAQDLGEPINQEDLAGTLMTFSFVVLEGMKMLSIELTPLQQEAWLYTWAAIGYLLGVDPKLTPTTLEESSELTYFIRERQVEVSPEGMALMASLLEGMRSIVPDFLDGLPATLVRFFLERDQWRGLNVADLLHVPPADWTTLVPRAVQRVSSFTDWVGDNTSTAARLMRLLSKDIVEGMLLVRSGGQRAPFHIPAEIQHKWQLQSGVRAAAALPFSPALLPFNAPG